METTLVAKITGDDSVNDTARRFGIHATDLGLMWAGDDGRVRVVFGDTYGHGWGGSGAGPAEGSDWRCNVLAYAGDDFTHGLVLDEVAARDDGMAAELFGRDRENEATVIPNSGTAVGATHYLHYMSVKSWDGPGRWRTNFAGIAVSHDGGTTWERPEQARWHNARWRHLWRHNHPFQVGCFATFDGGRYLFGTPNGRFGDARLARVSTEDILVPERYEYWTGADWRRGDEWAAKPVFRGPVGEMSVLYNDTLDQWLAVHLDEHRAAIVLRTAPEPTGPWTGGDVLVSGRDYPGLYGGYLHPSSAHGTTLHFAMSQWNPYNVFWMRTELG
ncbi:DUF4185 domain-containing protein [Labedaea rhizosphaerae]|uniref:DUF4185 domain-containing protein n=1 Tax=Labedaea rhizosphaerae TaxID=598644 RepID=UPI00105C7099|nr:DUF4185 domain-containing protein [Labedaea rhizosphaerae]